MSHTVEDRRFIVIEGPLGSGKTSLAKTLASKLGTRLVLEEENPFLLPFFKNMEKHAFQAQIFSLLSRYQQQKELLQVDLFQRGVICDYLFSSEHIFAELHLSQDEFVLYDKLLKAMNVRAPIADLVVFLQSPAELLHEKLQKSHLSYARKVPLSYIEELTRAYNQYFFHYNLGPLLVVNSENIDFSTDERYVDALVKEMGKVTGGLNLPGMGF
jgi:deoxyadenosine/deoxycytidine kinase